MTGKKRKALLGAVLGALALTAAVPMVVSGTASAQTNSRLCGRAFKSPRTGEITARVIEVRKDDSIACNEAKLLNRAGGDQLTPKQSPFLRQFVDLESADDWPSASFQQVVCEEFKNRSPEIGGTGNKNITFVGDNFPLPNDQWDICTNMNRSDTIFEMEEYWLYSHPSSPTVFFQRD
jgi:hypothetical protein